MSPNGILSCRSVRGGTDSSYMRERLLDTRGDPKVKPTVLTSITLLQHLVLVLQNDHFSKLKALHTHGSEDRQYNVYLVHNLIGCLQRPPEVCVCLGCCGVGWGWHQKRLLQISVSTQCPTLAPMKKLLVIERYLHFSI
jgi:hypothetical protein